MRWHLLPRMQSSFPLQCTQPLQKIWQKPDEDNTLVEKDLEDVARLVVDGTEHFIFYDGESGMEKAVWTRGNLGCAIVGRVSQEEMVVIVESIYEGVINEKAT